MALSEEYQKEQEEGDDIDNSWEKVIANPQNDVICVFEGKDDPPFYLSSVLEVFGEGTKLGVFIAGERKKVISIMKKESILKHKYKHKAEKLKALYFIDRDWDFTELGLYAHSNLFMTKSYSIENYLIDDQNVLISFLLKFRQYKDKDLKEFSPFDETRKFSKAYMALYEQLIEIFSSFTALCILDKEKNGDFSIIKHPEKVFHPDIIQITQKDDQLIISRSEADDYEFLVKILKACFRQNKNSKYQSQKKEFKEFLFRFGINDFQIKKPTLSLLAEGKENEFIIGILEYITGEKTKEAVLQKLGNNREKIISEKYIRGKLSLEFFYEYLRFLSEKKKN